ncbi:MAG: SWIM zinc finger domain-containing protein [Actinomycetota bacterium]|nr:SWIM zinc finger domain-containing protein [Actinomycetota bacterium]PLS83217.1 MAG: hypothetical protein CYG60_22505 [Actinomycetota bacterium]
MTKESLAQTPAPTTPDELAGRIEQELERLRAKRPGLSSRIDRAANLLVTHLACPRQRPIRVRVRQGRPRFLVNGSGGAVYSVDPSDWSCSCPDYHRRDATCKHAIACYVLMRASRPAPKGLRCEACGERFPRRVMVEVQESLTFQEGALLCTPCWIDSDAAVL